VTSLVANTAEEKRTLPWAARKIGDTSNGDGVYAITRNGLTVAEPLLRASALEIVTACNSFDALTEANKKLVSAAEKLLLEFDGQSNLEAPQYKALNELRRSVKNAKGAA
jgi:hypothetical protein